MKRLAWIVVLFSITACASTQPARSVVQDAHHHSDQIAVAPDERHAPQPTPATPPAPEVEPQQPAVESAATPPTQPQATARKPEKSNILAYATTPVPAYKLQSLTKLAESNDQKIANVFVGMYRKNVEELMGSAQNPFKRASIQGRDGETYEIIYYLTREPRKGRPITDRMLTPVIFKKSQVIAIGAYKLKKLLSTGTLGRQKKSGTGEVIRPAS